MTDQPAVEPDPWAVTAPGLVDGMPADTELEAQRCAAVNAASAVFVPWGEVPR